MTDKIEELIERLRTGYNGPGTIPWRVTPIHIEAADALAALRTQRDQVADALLVFAACARDIKDDEPDDEWAKFRLLVSDYRRAHRVYVALTGNEPPFPEDAHAMLAAAIRNLKSQDEPR